MGTGLISGTISREGCIEPVIKPTGRGKAGSDTAEPEGECVAFSAVRESESPARGPLRSNEVRLGKHRFFKAKRTGCDASHHAPCWPSRPLFVPLFFLPFWLCRCSLWSPHCFAPCFGARQMAQRWTKSPLRPQRLDEP